MGGCGASVRPGRSRRLCGVQHPGVRIGVVVPPEQQQLVWRGGAALAEMLGADPTRWVTRDEFVSDGVAAVLRKCPTVGSATRTEGT